MSTVFHVNILYIFQEFSLKMDKERDYAKVLCTAYPPPPPLVRDLNGVAHYFHDDRYRE